MVGSLPVVVKLSGSGINTRIEVGMSARGRQATQSRAWTLTRWPSTAWSRRARRSRMRQAGSRRRRSGPPWIAAGNSPEVKCCIRKIWSGFWNLTLSYLREWEFRCEKYTALELSVLHLSPPLHHSHKYFPTSPHFSSNPFHLMPTKIVQRSETFLSSSRPASVAIKPADIFSGSQFFLLPPKNPLPPLNQSDT